MQFQLTSTHSSVHLCRCDLLCFTAVSMHHDESGRCYLWLAEYPTLTQLAQSCHSCGCALIQSSGSCGKKCDDNRGARENNRRSFGKKLTMTKVVLATPPTTNHHGFFKFFVDTHNGLLYSSSNDVDFHGFACVPTTPPIVTSPRKNQSDFYRCALFSSPFIE